MAQKDANLIDESQVRAASENQFLRFYGEVPELEQSATESELLSLPESPEGLAVFGVSRNFPLDGKYALPHALAVGKIGSLNHLKLNAQPGEFLVFQLVLYSKEKNFFLEKIEYSGANEFTCFNLEGTDFKGEQFNRTISIHPKKTVILWCGIQLGTDSLEEISGKLLLHFNSGKREFPLDLHIAGVPLKNSGEQDDFRLARLRWLNSKIGFDDEVPAPYQPLKRKDNTIFLKGHTVTLGKNGLPEEICSGYKNLNREIGLPEKNLFTCPPVIRQNGIPFSDDDLEFLVETPVIIKWRSGNLCGEINFNGTLKYCLTAQAEKEIRLEYTLSDAPYMLGLGVKRPCIPPDYLEWHWDSARWEDSFWAGNIDSGCIFRLTSGKEEAPLLNCYYNWSPLKLPEVWDNNGKGGLSLKKSGNDLEITCFSGLPEKTGEQKYHFEFRLTPFHEIDLKKHFNTRIFHPHMHTFELQDEDCFTQLDFAELRKKGVNTINIHHAISLNPIINYPFSGKSLSLLQDFVQKAHQNGFKVLLYYTIREFTVHAPEFKALYAMNGEIFFPWQDNGKWPVTTPQEGPDPWFKNHCEYGFIPAWTEVIKSGPLHGIPDRAMVTVPRSRLENFYLEGLRFLLERCPIDGLYLDDCDLSETGMQRLVKIFRKYRGLEPILDFHAWESFNSTYCVPLRDMERFPFLSRLWLGEGVKYDMETYENWLIRLSGIPFGLTSEMLGKGNPFLGLQFGMTNRYGWGGNPCELWKLFDDFGIADCEMLLDLPCNQPGIRAAAWKKKDGSALIAISSWSEKSEKIKLCFSDLSGNGTFIQPEIPEFQRSMKYQTGDEIEIQPKEGVLLNFNPA